VHNSSKTCNKILHYQNFKFSDLYLFLSNIFLPFINVFLIFTGQRILIYQVDNYCIIMYINTVSDIILLKLLKYILMELLPNKLFNLKDPTKINGFFTRHAEFDSSIRMLMQSNLSKFSCRKKGNLSIDSLSLERRTQGTDTNTKFYLLGLF